jgi:L-asparagine oxygenase
MVLMSLPDEVRQVVADRGFGLIPQHLPERATLSAVSVLGAVTRVAGLADVQVLAPRSRVEATPNVYSGTFGHGVFPLHTDLAHWFTPPRYLALRCRSGGEGVSTLLLDGKDLIAGIGELSLRRSMVQPRRPIEGSRPLLRLLDFRSGETCLRWDGLFVRAATRESAATCGEVTKYLAEAVPLEITLLRPGDTLVVDNWRMLHGRSSVPPSSVSRRIERVYLGELL